MNEIIEQFKVVFNLDNKPLEIGLKQSESMLKTFGKAFAGIAATYLSYETIRGVIQGFADFNLKLAENSQRLGVSAQELQVLGGALQRYGGNVDSAASSLKSLQSHLEAAKYGGGALIEVAQKYGISVNAYAKSGDALKSIARQMDKLNISQKQAVASALGFDDSLTKALLDGSKNLDKLIQKQREYGVVSEEDIKKSKAFNEAWLDLQDTFKALIRDIGALLLPIITKVVNMATTFVKIVKDHKPMILGIFAAIAVAMTPILVGFTKMAAASVAAFAPLYAVIAVIVSIALVLEDIYYYFKGYDSITGDLVKKFPMLAKFLEPIKPIVMAIFGAFEGILEFISNPSWQTFQEIFVPVLDSVNQIWDTLASGISSAVDSLLQKFPILAAVLEPLKEAVQFVWDIFSKIFDLMPNLTSLAKGFVDSVAGFVDKIFGTDLSKKNNTQQAELPNAPSMPNSTTYHNTNSQSNSNVNVNQTFNNTINSSDPHAFVSNAQREAIKSVTDMRIQIGGA